MALTLAETRLKQRVLRTGDKLAKAAADYKKSPEPQKHSCGICEYMTADGGCRIVEGQVKPEMGCKYFEHK